MFCTGQVANFLATHDVGLQLHFGVSAAPAAVEQPLPAWCRHLDNIRHLPGGIIIATAADYGCFERMREEMQNETNTQFSVTYVSSREPHTLTLSCKFGGRDTWEEGLNSPVDAESMEALLDEKRSKKRGCTAKMVVSISEVAGAPVHVRLSLQHSGHDACGADELQEMKLHSGYVYLHSCIHTFHICICCCQVCQRYAKLKPCLLLMLCCAVVALSALQRSYGP